VIADKTYSSRGLRAYPRGRGIGHTVPEKQDQKRHRRNRGRRGGRPPHFDREIYRQRNTERTAALEDFLHTCNHHRSHTALGGQPTITRVNNPAGQYI